MNSRQEFSWVRVLVALTLLALLFAASVTPWVIHDRKVVALTRIRVPMCNSIDRLKGHPPSGFDRQRWDECVELTRVVYNNVCFFPANVNADTMGRLRDDVERKLEGDVEVNPETLRWLWDRLEGSCPYAKRVVERAKPQFLECLRAGGPPS